MLNYIIVTKIGAACYGGIFAVMKQKFVTIVRPTHAKSASGKVEAVAIHGLQT